MLAFFAVDGEDVAMRFVVRIVEYLVPLLLSGVQHLFGLVPEVCRIPIGVASEPAIRDFIVFEPVGDSLYVVFDDWSKFTS